MNISASSWIQFHPETQLIASFLQSECGALLNSTLSQLSNAGETLTLFVPSDSAWNRTFDMSGFTSWNDLCSGIGNTTTAAGNATQPLNQTESLNSPQIASPPLSCDDLLSTSGNMLPPITQVISCLPQISLYHSVRGNFSELRRPSSEADSSMGTITVMNTLFQTQSPFMLVANSSADCAYLQSACNHTAVLDSMIPTRDGPVYLIDHVLIPPKSLNYTLADLGLDRFQGQNLTAISQNQSVTVFVPISSQDILSVPNQQIFLTASNMSLFLNMQDGSNATLTVDDQGNATLDGASIIYANIPLRNGVLHLLDRMPSVFRENTTASPVATATAIPTAQPNPNLTRSRTLPQQ